MSTSVTMRGHGEHGQAVARLLELTDDLTVPENACGSWTQLYTLVCELAGGLIDHIRSENEILFPRVPAFQKPQRAV